MLLVSQSWSIVMVCSLRGGWVWLGLASFGFISAAGIAHQGGVHRPFYILAAVVRTVGIAHCLLHKKSALEDAGHLGPT